MVWCVCDFVVCFPGLIHSCFFVFWLFVLLQGDCRVIALSETTRDQVVQSINLFLASMVYRVLIVSYEVCLTAVIDKYDIHKDRTHVRMGEPSW